MTIMTTTADASTSTTPSTPQHNQLQQQHQRVRTKLFVLSLALCAVGLLLQIHQLNDFSTIGNGAANTKDGTMADTSNSASRQTLEDASASLFVPSLSYRIKGRSPYWEDVKVLKQGCIDPARDLEWEWYQPSASTSTSTTSKSTEHRLLIGLYAGFDQYARLMEHSAHLAKVYAHAWGPNVTVVILQGTAFSPHGCRPPGAHVTLNKIRLLFHAIDHHANNAEYDQVLLLDADALLVNMETDLTTLLDVRHDPSILLAAQPMRRSSSPTSNSTRKSTRKSTRGKDLQQEQEHHQHKINAGATLWNLNHPAINAVAIDWFTAAKDAVLKGTYRGDEEYLRRALLHQQREAAKSKSSRANKITVQWLEDEFQYSNGTVVQHFLRHGKDEPLDDRITKLKQAATTVCEQYPTECAKVPHQAYPID
jgi:hypothetical protein